MKGFINPDSIAIIGASNDISKIGGMLVANLINAGFDKSKIYPVNPKGEDIQGLKCYKNVKEIGKPVDLAALTIKSAFVIPEMDNLKDAGVKYITILTAGFKEESAEGAELEKQLVAKAKEYGIRILGPNCFGLLDPGRHVNVTFAKLLPKPGNISILSQSGAVGSSMLDWAHSTGVGIAKFITFGNKCDVDEPEVIDELAKDKSTHVIGIYCEGISNGKKFVKAIENMEPRKPVIIFKAGATAAGGAAASSHTGSIAGSDAVNSVVFKKLNMVRANDLDELYDLFAMFHEHTRMEKDKIGIITNAGGLGVMSADAAYNAKYIGAAKLSDKTNERLKTEIPTIAGLTNPIDIRGDAKAEYFEKAIRIIQEDPEVGGLVVMGSPLDTADLESVAENLVRIKNDIKVPIAICWAGGTKCAKAAAITRSALLPTYPTPDRAVHALDVLRRYTINEDKKYTPMIMPKKSGRAKVQEILATAAKEGRKSLTEAEGKEIFKAYDLPIPGEASVKTADEAVAACNKIGYPVVMKIISPDIAHKTDVGGVVVGVKDANAAKEAFDKIMASCKKNKPEARLDGVSIQQMVSGREVIISIMNDKQFGGILSFGLGGIFVEILREISQSLTPLSEEQLEEMIVTTKAFKLLNGARGTAKSDIAAMKDAMRKLVLISSENPEIKEIEINPVIVGEEGKGCWAVDALVNLF